MQAIIERCCERACRKFLALTVGQAWRSTLPSVVGGRPMILSAIAERLKRRSKDDFKGRHFEASLMDLLRKSGEFPMSYEELDDTAATVYEGI